MNDLKTYLARRISVQTLAGVGVLGLVLAGPEAYAGSIGVGVGGLVDVPQIDGDPAANCSSDSTFFTGFSVRDGAGDAVEVGGSDSSCKNFRIGGQLEVPIRIGLSPLAALRITPGVVVGQYDGAIQWGNEAEQAAGFRGPGDTSASQFGQSYQGYTAVMIRPQLGLGAEFAFRPTGITPYLGAEVNVGQTWDFHSLGANGNGQHSETYTPYQARSGDHCNTKDPVDIATDPTCKADAIRREFGVGAELLLGVRSAGTDTAGFFAEASYSILALGQGEPAAGYDGSGVQLRATRYDPIGLTVGLILPL